MENVIEAVIFVLRKLVWVVVPLDKAWDAWPVVFLIIAGAALLAMLARTFFPSWRRIKAIRIFLTAVAWLGLLVIMEGTFWSFLSTIQAYPSFLFGGEMGGLGFLIALFLGGIGTLLALIGGFAVRPRYLWVGLITVGAIYIASFLGFISVQFHDESLSALEGMWVFLPRCGLYS